MHRDELKQIVREVLVARLGLGGNEAPAAAVSGAAAAGGPLASVSVPTRSGGRTVVTEREVLEARTGSRKIVLRPGAIVTPLARETAERFGVALVEEPEAQATRAAAPRGTPPAVAAPASPALPTPAAPAPAADKTPGCAGGVVALGADHGGFALKESLKAFLEKEAGWRVLDFGTFGTEAVDYPDFAHKVAAAVARGEACRGVVIDGVGVGSCMAANRHSGVRAAAAHGILEVVNAREHNNANVLCLGGRMAGDLLARALVTVFLTTAFAGGRHQRRVDKIEAGAQPEGACSSRG